MDEKRRRNMGWLVLWRVAVALGAAAAGGGGTAYAAVVWGGMDIAPVVATSVALFSVAIVASIELLVMFREMVNEDQRRGGGPPPE